MNFKQFLEQGTVGGPFGGPRASGALGMNIFKAIHPSSPMANISKSMAVPGGPFSLGTKRPTEPVPGGPISLGTKTIPGQAPSGAFGGGGSKMRY